MLEEHLNSRAFEVSFSEARLKKYRESLRLAVMDGGSEEEMLSMDSKIILLGSRKGMDDIVEAFAKVLRNIDKLA